MDDLKLVSYIREGNLEGVRELSCKWTSEDYLRLSSTYIFPLHLATCFGQVDVVKLLLDTTELDINSQNQEKSTALHYAAAQGQVGIVKLLVGKEQLDVFIVDGEGKTPFARAQTDTIRELLSEFQKTFEDKHSLEVGTLIKEGRFSELIRKCEDPRIKKLVPVNYVDPDTGSSLLHQAAAANEVGTVEWLLKNNADIFVKDKEGRLPFDVTTNPNLKELLSQVSEVNEPNPCKKLEGTLKKWTNLASGYKDRYFILEEGKLSYFKSQQDIEKECRGTIVLKNAHILWKEGTLLFEVESAGRNKFDLKAEHVVEAKLWVEALLKSKRYFSDNFATCKRFGGESVGYSTTRSPQPSPGFNTMSSILPDKPSTKRFSLTLPMESTYSESQTSTVGLDTDYSVKATLMSIGTHADVLLRMLESASSGCSGDTVTISSEVLKTLLDSIHSQKIIINSAIQLDAKREIVWRHINSRQLEEQTMWKSNLETLAKDHHELERVVKKQSKLKKFQKAGRAVMAINAMSGASSQAASRQISGKSLDASNEDSEVCLSDDEETFFDAEDEIDTSIAQKFYAQKHGSQTSVTQTAVTQSSEVDPIHDITTAYSGYPADGKFRQSLEMSGDIVPDVSIWSVLKNSVGKDLSKIAVPVEFNEPTSMLQRMCEDMEYSELLDIASQQPDSIDRMLWVAGFAMSNYSSTLGRTGKPFNPLLGETFEYVRPDRGFRYVSEQVSHHPPISACYCESPNYVFQSEVNVVSKFWGKSFELNPQGVTHVYLKLPGEGSQETSSDSSSISSGGEIKEHYTWTKVTSAMNNIIIGTMYIEHYGDMVIKNHRTGDECTLTFHQTGWRSSNKHVVRGIVRDAKGRDVWEIGGRWDDKLVARRVGLSDGDLVDHSNHCTNLATSPDNGSQPILLWKMAPHPSPNIAYRLTHFAVTLNQMTEGLQNYLPPTDSRHRPDQKAMERGDFSAANDLKTKLESNQRQRRNQSTNPHQPRWFSKKTDLDSNSSIWLFDDHYWVERQRCGTESKSQSGPAEWDNVPKIFVI